MQAPFSKLSFAHQQFGRLPPLLWPSPADPFHPLQRPKIGPRDARFPFVRPP